MGTLAARRRRAERPDNLAPYLCLVLLCSLVSTGVLAGVPAIDVGETVEATVAPGAAGAVYELRTDGNGPITIRGNRNQ